MQTACSSSLVAVHLACLSLLSGECDMALAGGSSLCIPHRVGYFTSPGSMVSAVGHCRPFDVRADGTVFGSGVGLVVLKPLAAAIDAGDRIHAVIRGSAINNDGSAKMGYAAPNPAAQADVIAEAHAVSGIDSSTVSYVECHGTGTPLGDPIEIQGLRAAFEVSQTSRSAPCVLGSVKSNIGHLEVAAGIAGLIKTILCLKNKALPATLHYTSPNPELRLDQSPFVVQSKYGPWECDGVRRAGVSSFGVGGTNAHVVLEEAPAEASEVSAHAEPAGPQVILLSAQTAAALGESRTALAAALETQDGPRLSDVAYTLARRRKHNVTMAAVVHDREHAATVLRAAEHDNVFVGEAAHDGEHGDRADAAPTSDRVVFLFPGQGAQHVGMAKGSMTPSRSSPNTSTPAPPDSATRQASTCMPKCSTGPQQILSALTVRNRRCSRWNTRSRSWSTLSACAPGRTSDTAPANTSRPPWPAYSTCRQRSKRCRCAPALCMSRRPVPWSRWLLAPMTSRSTCHRRSSCPR